MCCNISSTFSIKEWNWIIHYNLCELKPNIWVAIYIVKSSTRASCMSEWITLQMQMENSPYIDRLWDWTSILRINCTQKDIEICSGIIPTTENSQREATFTAFTCSYHWIPINQNLSFSLSIYLYCHINAPIWASTRLQKYSHWQHIYT